MATTGISLIREQTEAMRLPRFLWVPFELGRPFGAPNESEFQRRVLLEALELLERSDGPVVLADFADDAPRDGRRGDLGLPYLLRSRSYRGVRSYRGDSCGTPCARPVG